MEGVNVALTGDISALTDLNGYANISDVLISSYSVVVSKDSYETVYDVIDLSVEQYREINITLLPSLVIYVEDFISGLPIENAIVDLYNGVDFIVASTNSTGYVVITNLHFSWYMLSVRNVGYDTYWGSVDITISSYYEIYLDEMVAPEGAEGVVNRYDSDVVGNYWDDFSGIVVLAEEESIYEVPGENSDNPIDRYPLLEPFNVSIVIINTTTTTTTTTITTTITETTTTTINTVITDTITTDITITETTIFTTITKIINVIELWGSVIISSGVIVGFLVVVFMIKRKEQGGF